MKYAIKVLPNITYGVVQIIYEEAVSLGIFDAPLYDKYLYSPPTRILDWEYLGVTPDTRRVVGCGRGSLVIEESEFIIDLSEVL